MTQATRRSVMRATKKVTAYRALPQFDRLPKGHVLFQAPDLDCEPHLHIGEFAVVDTTDRTAVNGELYLLQFMSGSRRRTLRQVYTHMCNITGPGAAETLTWWHRDLNRSSMSLDDGPMSSIDNLLFGRVVGFTRETIGPVLASEAGWEDGEAGNAAFDPVEYVALLLGAGWKPMVTLNRSGEADGVHILIGRHNSDADQAEIYRVGALCAEAPDGMKMVARECMRRGLIEWGSRT